MSVKVTSKGQNFLELSAYYTKKPLYFCMGELVHLKTAIHPGKGENLSTETKEKIRRYLAGPGAAVLGLLYLPFALPGLGVEWLAGRVKKDPFTLWKGALPEIDGPPKKIVSINVCGLPSNLPELFGCASSLKTRSVALTNFLKGLNADTIVFQELGYDTAVELFEKMKHLFANCAFGFGRNFPFMDSGLAIFTKCRVTHTGFHPFQEQSKMLRGIAYLGTPNMTIFTSHMDYGFDALAKKRRAQQFTDLLHLMRQHDHSIFLGDTNLDRTREDQKYQEQIEDQFHNPAPFVEGQSTATEKIKDAVLKRAPSKHPHEYVDYCLLTRENRDMQVEVELVDTYDDESNPLDGLTDHKALVASVRFSNDD